MMSKYKYKVSVIVPVYNEEESLPHLQVKIDQALKDQNFNYEIIYVDDGSSDKSVPVLNDLAAKNKHIKVIEFRRNYGQTAAMSAGIDHAQGEILIPMDADLQNDPADIPHLLAKIDEGYDVVSGWRKNRQDTFVNRKLPSMIANKIISIISGVHLHDYGCSLKAYKHEVLEDVRLYGELHRFIPICASWAGARVTEIPVSHYARQYGESKYGINRTLKVILDLIVLKFLTDYSHKPIYVFGSLGVLSIMLSFAFFAWAIALKIFQGVQLDGTPLPILGAMFVTVSIQILLMGLLADMIMRTYYESQDKRIYKVKNTTNIGLVADLVSMVKPQ